MKQWTVFTCIWPRAYTTHRRKERKWEEQEEGGGGGGGRESERCGLVTFNLVALHIAILHFTYDGDIQDNNNKNNQGRQVNKLSPQTTHNSENQKSQTGRQENDF